MWNAVRIGQQENNTNFIPVRLSLGIKLPQAALK
jgi:hypothetical protein